MIIIIFIVVSSKIYIDVHSLVKPLPACLPGGPFCSTIWFSCSDPSLSFFACRAPSRQHRRFSFFFIFLRRRTVLSLPFNSIHFVAATPLSLFSASLFSDMLLASSIYISINIYMSTRNDDNDDNNGTNLSAGLFLNFMNINCAYTAERERDKESHGEVQSYGA